LRWLRGKGVKRKRIGKEKMKKEVRRRGNQDNREENEEQESSRYRRKVDGVE